MPSLVVYLTLAVLLVAALLLVTGRLSPSLPGAAKGRPYESGVSEPIATQTRWPVRFALVGMLFLIFDVEALFFYPWAVVLRDLGWGGIAAIISFFIVLGVGYNYALIQGVDKIVPVDVYVPGCPPTPEALLDSLIKLKEHVAADSRSARHGAQTGVGVGIVHNGASEPPRR